MTLDEARKLANQPAKENYVLINVDYDFTIVLPHKEGMAFITALGKAEQTDNSYGGKKHITPLDSTKFAVTHLSHFEYSQRRMATLLGISISDLERAEEEAKAGDKDPF